MRRSVFWFLLFLWFETAWGGTDLSVFAGWTGTGSIRSEVGKIDLDNFSLAGIRYERRYAIFGLENNIAYYFGSFALREADNKEDALSYSANLVIHVPVFRLVPFVSFGLGLLHRFGDSEPDIGTRFQTNFGLGLKMRNLLGPLGLRTDFRRFTIRGVLGDNLKTNELSGGILVSF